MTKPTAPVRYPLGGGLTMEVTQGKVTAFFRITDPAGMEVGWFGEGAVSTLRTLKWWLHFDGPRNS